MGSFPDTLIDPMIHVPLHIAFLDRAICIQVKIKFRLSYYFLAKVDSQFPLSPNPKS